MKSIKEKSEEVFPIEERDSLETELQRRKMRLCYEDGANYVLEQVEKLIYSNPTCERAIFELGELVEQLKK
jgi:hypothetical protein